MISPDFPCATVPVETAAVRLLGLYEQCQKGFYMQRVKVYGGRLQTIQWRALAQLAQRLTPGTPLHLTTRQDLEFHNVTLDQIPILQKGLADAGLTTVGACGDTLRNITQCPCGGACSQSDDLTPLLDAICAATSQWNDLFALPRKFKISLSGCTKACGRPWINDLGFVALPDGHFQVIGAGSLGARPKTGIELYPRIPIQEVVPLILAALRLFHEEGDREHRHKARLRHVRERMGDTDFLHRLETLFQKEKAAISVNSADPPKASPPPQTSHLTFNIADGELNPEHLIELLDALGDGTARLTVGFEHDLHLYGFEAQKLPRSWQAAIGGPRIIACPGARFCSSALVETGPIAQAVREQLPNNSRVLVCISGCPNGCSHPTVADIGLVGRLKKVDGQRLPHFDAYAGGGHGKTPVLAERMEQALPLQAAAERVGRLAAERKPE